MKTIGARFLMGVVAFFGQGDNTLSFASTVGSENGTCWAASPSGPATQSPVPVVTASAGWKTSSLNGIGRIFAVAILTIIFSLEL